MILLYSLQKRHKFAGDNSIFPKPMANKTKRWTRYSARNVYHVYVKHTDVFFSDIYSSCFQTNIRSLVNILVCNSDFFNPLSIVILIVNASWVKLLGFNLFPFLR